MVAVLLRVMMVVVMVVVIHLCEFDDVGDSGQHEVVCCWVVAVVVMLPAVAMVVVLFPESP